MASNYYDKNKDYSAAIEAAKASGASQATIKQLETERQNKINDVYGGKEPTMWNSDKTYKELSGSNANWQNQAVIRNAVNVANSAANSTVQQQMEQAAQNNNWDLVGSLANQLATPDGYYGGYNMEYANSVVNDLQNKYGYNANNYYQGLFDAVYGEGAWDGGTGTGKPVYNDLSDALVYLYNSGQGGASANGNPLSGLDSNALSMLIQYAGGNGGAFGNSGAPKWNGSEFDSVLNSMVDKWLNMDFEDWTQSDQYAALADRYGQQGQMSMRDLLGQMASHTGGLASSYAATAANQEYNNWMANLEKVAREMYGLEQDDLMDNIQMVQGMRQDDYNQFLDALSQYNTDRNFNYNVWQDQQARLADRAEMMASVGDFSGLKELGYTDDQIALLQSAYQMEQTQAVPKKAGSTPPIDSPADDGGDKWSAVVDWVNKYGDDAAENYIKEHYKELGYSSQSAAMAGWANYQMEQSGGAGMNESHFKASMQSLSAQLQASKDDAALGNVDRIWDDLNREQRETLQRLLSTHGIEYQP